MCERQHGMIRRPAEMRMSVGLARHAVSGPTGVTNARRSRQAGGRHPFGQRVDPPDSFGDVEVAVPRCGGDPGAVIPSVFQPPQALQKEFVRPAMSYVTYDTAHG